MKKILRLIATSLGIVFMATGCSSQSEKPKVENKPPVELYQNAQTLLQSASFEKAKDVLEALDNRYPFGEHSDQVQMDLIYTYYKLNDTALALANIDRFIRLNPTHKDLDYLYYMRGLTNMGADKHFFQDLFGIDRYNRDPSYALQAFKDFNTLITHYKDSQYAADAWHRMVFIKNKLAHYEVAIAEWYIKREAYVAAINRAKIVLNNYADTASTEQALEIMIGAYDKLNLEKPKENALAILTLNYPNNALANSTKS